MLNRVKQQLKNEKGLTLIELLAVVVILGIIAAIAVPSIGGLINNSKKDAHIANAKIMKEGARMAVAGDDLDLKSGSATITYDGLVSGGYIEPVKPPTGTNYENSQVEIAKAADGNFTYKVTLAGDGLKKSVVGDPADPNVFNRKSVDLK